MNDPAYQRATLLYQQRRYDLAERELRQELAQNPTNARAHSLLALCLLESKKYQEAADEGGQAIAHAPDDAFSFHCLSAVQAERHRFPEALTAIDEAIRIEPHNPDHWLLRSQIHFSLEQWPQALQDAEAGLAADAQHQGCLNLRAMSLTKLNRQGDAARTIDQALQNNPDSALSHANLGWTLLHQNNPKQALIHFREALRLQPGLEFARAGMITALRARYLVYRIMLRYFLFMSRLGKSARWGVIIGFYILQQVLGALSQSNPTLRPYVLPMLIVCVAFVFLTWLANPLFNLLLRLNRFGRYALTKQETRAANAIAITLSLAIALLIALLYTHNSIFFLSAVYVVLLTLPLSSIFVLTDNAQLIMLVATATVAALCAITIALAINDNPAFDAIWHYTSYALLGTMILPNYLASMNPRRL